MPEIDKCIEWLKCLKLRSDISLGEDGYKYIDKIIELLSLKPLSEEEVEPQMELTVDTVVKGLLTQGYEERGGSKIYRLLRDKEGKEVKVFYSIWKTPNQILVIVRQDI